MNSVEFNRKAAKKLANEKDFNPEKMVVCVGCGRTAIQSQRVVDPGRKDRIYCTCNENGLPMVPVVTDDD